MKKYALLFSILPFLVLTAYAQEYAPAAKKYYCNAEQIELTDAMILVHLNDKLFETDAILTDQGGVYFTEDMLRCTYCRRQISPQNSHKCPKCN
jgi:hypothetical protein